MRELVERPRERRGAAFAVTALLTGAACIGTSALWVKVSETGPVSTGFWRVFLALPLLWVWALAERYRPWGAGLAVDRRLMIWAGLFFAGDLAVWHWSIVLTSVANSTLLANLAPIFVTLAAWLLFHKMPSARFLAGLAIALAGMAVLIGGDFRLEGRQALGDALGVVTAMFYAGYQLVVTRLRASVSTASIMAWSGVITAVVLLPLALASGERFLPFTDGGWGKLIGLALVSQVVGQSLIAYAMAHLPATFSSVGLLFQPVMAALFAWILLGETLGWIEIAGAVAVLIGICIVHQAETAR
jgi:drug/metabolite transporter (DMT)-like permease